MGFLCEECEGLATCLHARGAFSFDSCHDLGSMPHLPLVGRPEPSKVVVHTPGKSIMVHWHYCLLIQAFSRHAEHHRQRMRATYYHKQNRPVPPPDTLSSERAIRRAEAIAEEDDHDDGNLSTTNQLHHLLRHLPSNAPLGVAEEYLRDSLNVLVSGHGTLKQLGLALYRMRIDLPEEEVAGWGMDMDQLYDVVSAWEKRAHAYLLQAEKEDPTMSTASYHTAKYLTRTIDEASLILLELRAIERDSGVTALRENFADRSLTFQTTCY